MSLSQTHSDGDPVVRGAQRRVATRRSLFLDRHHIFHSPPRRRATWPLTNNCPLDGRRNGQLMYALMLTVNIDLAAGIKTPNVTSSSVSLSSSTSLHTANRIYDSRNCDGEDAVGAPFP